MDCAEGPLEGYTEDVIADRIWADYWIKYAEASEGTGVILATGAPMLYDNCTAVYGYTNPCDGEYYTYEIWLVQGRRALSSEGCNSEFPEYYHPYCIDGGPKPDPGEKPAVTGGCPYDP
jgi:hypothetical protein